jgi:hypothetical protein
MTTHRMTRESFRTAGASYGDAAELVPPWGLSPEDVAELDIPPEDRRRALIFACGMTVITQTLFARMCVTMARTAAIVAVAARADYAATVCVLARDAAACAAAAACAEDACVVSELANDAAVCAADAARAAVDGRPAAVLDAVVEEQIRVLVALLQGEAAP